MVDVGPPNKATAVQRCLIKLAVRPEEIRLILLTHGDADHVGSACDVQALTGAKVAIHNLDSVHLEQGIVNWPPGTNFWGRFLRGLLRPVMIRMLKFPPTKADFLLGNKEFPLDEFGIAGKVLHTPGHTPGSVSVLLESGEAFVGCLAHNGLPFRLRPGFPIYADNLHQVKQSWKVLIEKGARIIYPAHGDPFPVDVILRSL